MNTTEQSRAELEAEHRAACERAELAEMHDGTDADTTRAARAEAEAAYARLHPTLAAARESESRPPARKRRTINVKTIPGARPEYETETMSRARVSSAPYRPSVTEAELDALRAELDERRGGFLSEPEVWERCRRAVLSVCRTASADEIDALTSELAERAFRRHGLPGARGRRVIPAGRITRAWLAHRARNVWGDSQAWRDTLDAHARERRQAGREYVSVERMQELGELDSVGARAFGDELPPLAEDLRQLADGVAARVADVIGRKLTPGERECVRVAVLSGLPVEHDKPPTLRTLAAQLGRTVANVEKQAQRGRKLITAEVSALALVECVRAEAERLALVEPAADDELDLARGADAEHAERARAARWMLDKLAPAIGAPRATVKRDHAERESGALAWDAEQADGTYRPTVARMAPERVLVRVRRAVPYGHATEGTSDAERARAAELAERRRAAEAERVAALPFVREWTPTRTVRTLTEAEHAERHAEQERAHRARRAARLDECGRVWGPARLSGSPGGAL